MRAAGQGRGEDVARPGCICFFICDMERPMAFGSLWPCGCLWGGSPTQVEEEHGQSLVSAMAAVASLHGQA